MSSLSPLRYPGGKTKIYERVKKLIKDCNYGDRTYVEPFAGGFGIGLKLLAEDIVEFAILNDFDRHIYNFWFAVFHYTDKLCGMIEDIDISIEERTNQKLIYANAGSTRLQDGFATLFLNRVNYSGIIKGGPIGGLKQTGKYLIDCRFRKDDIIQKIRTVAALGRRIKLSHIDANALIGHVSKNHATRSLLYIDPPYVVKGSQLYANYYKEEDHLKLAKKIRNELGNDIPWFMTYDDSNLIKKAYEGFHMQSYDLVHNAGGSVKGKEIVITNIPNDLFKW